MPGFNQAVSQLFPQQALISAMNNWKTTTGSTISCSQGDSMLALDGEFRGCYSGYHANAGFFEFYDQRRGRK